MIPISISSLSLATRACCGSVLAWQQGIPQITHTYTPFDAPQKDSHTTEHTHTPGGSEAVSGDAGWGQPRPPAGTGWAGQTPHQILQHTLPTLLQGGLPQSRGGPCSAGEREGGGGREGEGGGGREGGFLPPTSLTLRGMCGGSVCVTFMLHIT